MGGERGQNDERDINGGIKIMRAPRMGQSFRRMGTNHDGHFQRASLNGDTRKRQEKRVSFPMWPLPTLQRPKHNDNGTKQGEIEEILTTDAPART
jgi:hypothetical protein